ncbi:arsenite methyltransferase [Haloferula sargassicola]|uniref:Arsenite methyltransferase n=1 Tax=Haloferula sargassicola TaxID=490096 RepID=A0ABP9USM2_9BACT
MNREDPQERRKRVSLDYASAVRRPPHSCCGQPPVPKGVVAKLADYDFRDMAGLPAEAVANSFGCGNPLAFSSVAEGQVVLDLGSGAGIDLLLAAKKVGPSGRVIGVDMTEAMISKARENIAEAGLINAEVRQGLIEALPVEDASVDWVISNCVINLSPEKHQVFAEIARVLRPGGHMLVSDIVAEQLPAELSGNARLHSCCLAGAIPENAYLEGLRAAGLVEVEVLDRLVYDQAQIEAFIGHELVDPAACGGDETQLARTWAPRLVGKIASARIRARKPAHSAIAPAVIA